MPIQELAVSNFKSFRHLEIQPDNFNVIIGSNASGKSNFIQVIKFIRDIAKYGLSNAISLQGGVEYLRNTRIGAGEPFSINIRYLLEEQKTDIVAMSGGFPVSFRPREICYAFSLAFPDAGETFEIASDALEVEGEFFRQEEGEQRSAGTGTIALVRAGGPIQYCICPPKGLELREEELFPYYFQRVDIPEGTLLMTLPLFVPGIPSLEWIFRGMKVFDFDPRLLKKAVPIMGKTDLEKDGSNLAIVIKRILEDPGKKETFTRLLRDVLPFVDDVAVEKFMDMSLFLKLREVYSREKYLPASMISDGTINICALLIALYFEERPVTIIEEPERNIHPYLISRLVEMLKDASRSKQVIVTTHNPEMVKHVDIHDILLISRDSEGFSRLIRPANKKEIRAFLEDEIGIEELFIQNMLGIE
ncbi:MAG TPA: AAA family ATPase [Methanolinea sp.]|jgi:predicted ATPase|nr:MAG: histidine/lysine/arginine/ornithine transporter subunit [Methanoregulaceae archaeon PtaB.Bin009]OPY41675.1 MAG: histidine/lysine/arginine/ornithine transporter subunit [Methanoregulaceae archaeon PtaU1.Bin066]HII75766.1 AAA family ATPase [Methanolinea sp.]HNQ29324.1 AAA family ATPase [Methanolinea sp.]